jgi:Ubiquitin family
MPVAPSNKKRNGKNCWIGSAANPYRYVHVVSYFYVNGGEFLMSGCMLCSTTKRNNTNHVPRVIFFYIRNACIQQKIQVQILTGRKIPLLVDPNYDVLLDIKKKIQIKEGIHPDQQILLLNGIRLQEEGHRSLRDLYIEEGACLFLTLRNRGG